MISLHGPRGGVEILIIKNLIVKNLMGTYQNSLSWAAAGKLIIKKVIIILYARSLRGPLGTAQDLLIISFYDSPCSVYVCCGNDPNAHV